MRKPRKPCQSLEHGTPPDIVCEQCRLARKREQSRKAYADSHGPKRRREFNLKETRCTSGQHGVEIGELCNTCKKAARLAIRREDYARSPEIGRAQTKKFRQANPDMIKAASERRRARKMEAYGHVTAAEWAAILKKHDNKCALCGLPPVPPQKLHKDHIIPLSQGGPDMAHNIQPVHHSCNASKKATILPLTQGSLFENVKKSRKDPALCGAQRHPKTGRGHCSECEREAGARWRAAHPEEMNEYRLDWQARNPEKAAAAVERYRKKNPEAGREAAKRWRDAHPGAAAEATRRHRENKKAASSSGVNISA